MARHRKRDRAHASRAARSGALDVRTAPLDAESVDALGVLAAALLGLRRFLWGDSPVDMNIHIASRIYEPTAPVIARAWTLASAILARSLGTETQLTIVLDAAKHDLAGAMADVDSRRATLAAEPIAPRPSRRGRTTENVALDDAGTLLHEVALEERDAVLFLATDRDGSQLLAWHPEPRQNTFVELLKPLFETAEAFARVDRLLDLEREAAGWWFKRWAVTRVKDSAFATRVREQEWVFADRQTLATGSAVLAALVTPTIEIPLPEKQRMLAKALLRSRSSLYVVEERSGDQSVLYDIADDRRLTMHEHSTTTNYRPADVGAGRLLRIGDHVVRSPGMAFFTPFRDRDFASVTAPIFRRAQAALYDSTIAVEAVLSSILGERVPRDVPVAPSAHDAEERLQAFNEIMEEEGLSHEVTADQAPPELRSTVSPREGLRFLGYDIDEPVAAYAAALGARAGVPGVSAGTSRRKRRR